MPKHHVLHREQILASPLPLVFEFFSDAGNLEAITPSFLSFGITTPRPIDMKEGARIEYRLSLAGVPFYWRTIISVWEPPHRFVDEQESGPFAYWHHEHRFEDLGGSVKMTDTVTYLEPLGWLGTLAHYLFVRRLLDAVFAFRAREISAQLARWAEGRHG